MEAITIQETIEKIFIYGESGGNIDDAVNIYSQRFPDKVRSRASFYLVVQQFSSEGTVQPRKRNCRKTIAGDNNKIAVLAAVTNNPHISIRKIARGFRRNFSVHYLPNSEA